MTTIEQYQSPASIYTPRQAGDINIPLLVETLSHIEYFPETWEQSDWRALVYDYQTSSYNLQNKTRCGANMCFAGHAAMVAGGKWLLDKKRLEDLQKIKMLNDTDGMVMGALVPTPEEKVMAEKGLIEIVTGDETAEVIEEYSVPVVTDNGAVDYTDERGVHVSVRARLALGLTSEQANTLFNGDNSLNQLRFYVAHLILNALNGDGAKPLPDYWDNTEEGRESRE